MMIKKPLSFYTNRLSILFVCIFFVISCVVALKSQDHRAIIISLLIAVSGTIGLFIITIASPNRQIQWIDKIINLKKGDKK